MSSGVGIRSAARSASSIAWRRTARDAAPGERRAGHDRRAQAELLLDPRAGVVEVGAGDVPLVQGEHGRAAGLHRQLADPQVLGGDALGGVADDDRDVGALGRALGAQLRVVVDRAGDLRPPAQPGGVDQDDAPPADLDLGVDRVAGGAGAAR